MYVSSCKRWQPIIFWRRLTLIYKPLPYTDSQLSTPSSINDRFFPGRMSLSRLSNRCCDLLDPHNQIGHTPRLLPHLPQPDSVHAQEFYGQQNIHHWLWCIMVMLQLLRGPFPHHLQCHTTTWKPLSQEKSMLKVTNTQWTALIVRRLHITFIDKDGDEHTFEVANGDNLLDIALEHDIEMEGEQAFKMNQGQNR